MTPRETTSTASPSSEEQTLKSTYDPNLFISIRSSSTADSTAAASSSTKVAGRIYYPSLTVDIHNEDSILNAALQILFSSEYVEGSFVTPELKSQLQLHKVVGGMTNALYRISNLSSHCNNSITFDSILVRVFGAEGMIDRDVETCTFAALADKDIAPPYYGRFGNGRLEGWLEGYKPLILNDFQKEQTYLEIAVKMAELHAGFTVPEELKEYHDEKEPGLWNQLFSWMKQAKGITSYKTSTDNDRASSLLELDRLEKECQWIHSVISNSSKSAKVGFCHNDLLPANIMKHEISGDVKFIDFEYGGVNYIAFDIANHFNEWAGGIDNDEGKTDYGLFPNEEQQVQFISAYLKAGSDEEEISQGDLEAMMMEVEAFLLANHLYWGLWAVNQAAIEGTEGFDYLAYGVNRFNRYFETKRVNLCL